MRRWMQVRMASRLFRLGKTEPQVISATLPLDAGKDYTVVALNTLANIEPLVLTDNNAAPAAGKAHVRFVHASPDAPAVDVAVKGGPVIFSNVAFKGVGDYTPVDAGTYNLEVRLAGTNTVALDVPNVTLSDGSVYTVFAMGLGGRPAGADCSPQRGRQGAGGYECRLLRRACRPRAADNWLLVMLATRRGTPDRRRSSATVDCNPEALTAYYLVTTR